MTDTNAFVVDNKKFEKEGLDPAGPFLFQVANVRATEKKYGNAEDAVTVPIIQMKLVATHTVETDSDGLVTGEVEVRPIMRNYEDFALTGPSSRKLKTLYQAITGRGITGGNGSHTDLLSAAEELVGGSAWNNVFHSKFTRQDGSTGFKAMLTNTFKSKPPKSFRPRTEETEE